MKQAAENHARIVRNALEKAMKKKEKEGFDNEETVNELKQLSRTIFDNVKEANAYVDLMNKSFEDIHNYLESRSNPKACSKTEATYS